MAVGQYREATLAAARALEASDYPSGEGIPAIYVGLGNTEAAFTWLERIGLRT